MPRINPKPFVAALLAAVLVSGCNDSPVEPAEPLTLEESEALLTGVQELGSDLLESATDTMLTPDSPEIVMSCPLGGQVTMVFDSQLGRSGDTVSVNTSYTFDPDGCVLPSDGYEFTLDGNPNLLTAVNLKLVGSQFLMDGSVTGGLDWKLDDRSGTCMADLMLSGDIGDISDVESFSGRLSGTMCGHEVGIETAMGSVL